MSMERCVGLSLGPKAWGPSQQLQRNPNAALRHFFWYTLGGSCQPWTGHQAELSSQNKRASISQRTHRFKKQPRQLVLAALHLKDVIWIFLCTDDQRSPCKHQARAVHFTSRLQGSRGTLWGEEPCQWGVLAGKACVSRKAFQERLYQKGPVTLRRQNDPQVT